MSHPAEGEGDELSITPSNPRGTFAGGQRQRASTSWTTPAQQFQQAPTPPSGRRRASTRMPTMEPFIEEEEEREEGGLPGTEATVQPPSARNPQPTPTRDDSRRVSFSYSVPSADTPLHTPDETGTRTPSPSILRRPSSTTSQTLAPQPEPEPEPEPLPPAPVPAAAAAAASASPSPGGGSRPLTSPAFRRVNPLPAIRNWWSPRSKPAPEQQPDPSPGAASATVGQEEQAAQAVSVSGTPPPHAQGEEAQQPGAGEPSEVPPTTEDNTRWQYREPAQWGDHGPDDWDSGEWPAGYDGEDTPHDAQDDSTSAQSGAATPWRTSVRGQDDYNFGDVDFQSGIRARAFDNLLKKIKAEGLFLDEALFYRIRYFARINEPKIDLEVLDDMNDESTRTLSGWLIDNGRDMPQGLQDRVVSEVTRILGDMRDRIGTLLIEESTYVKVFADDLEVLLKRPPGRTRSLISGVSSAISVPLPEHDFEELDRDHLRSLSKEAVIDFLFTRDMQRESHINSLHAVCEDYEARMTELEEEIRYIEVENTQQRAAEQDLVQDAINSVIGHITAEDVTPVRDTASQPSSASTRALRTRATTLASASSGRSQSSARSAGSAEVGFAPISAPATAPLSVSEIPPIPVEGLDGPADPIRRQLLEDLRDIWRNEEAEDEMAHRFIRELARSANVAIRPDMEEGSRVDPTALAFATAESITPEQLLARIRRVTMERDRARRAESEAQDQLRSRLAMQQQPSTTPAGLIRRISSVFMRGRQSTSAGVAAPATALPTASLNHPSLVRLLRIVSQMADELSGCSFAASNLAQTMARCGKMDTDKSPVLPALNDLRAIVRTLRIEKPENPTENDLAGGNELWQALYLDDMEGYMILVRRQVSRAISTLENRVDEWDRTNKRANKNTRSDARRQSSTITTQAAGVERSSQQGEADKLDDPAGRSNNKEGIVLNLRPLVPGGWPAAHPNHPCEHCTLEEVNTCGCTHGTSNGMGDGAERNVEEATKSQESSRSVSFADQRPGILKNGRRGRRPGRLDLSRTESQRSNSTREGSNRPSTPHPLKLRRDSGSDLPSLERATTMPRAHDDGNRNCLCHTGVRVAYYTCSSMAGQLATEEASRARRVGRPEAAEGTQAGSSEPRSVERWLLDVASDVASMVGWGSPRITHASSRSTIQDPAQIPLPPSSGSSYRTTPPSVSSAEISFHTPSGQPQAQTSPGQNQTPGPRRTPIFPETTNRRGRRATAPANIGNPLTRLPLVLEADPGDGGVLTGLQAAEEWSGVEYAPEQAPAPVSEPATRMSTFRDLLLNDPLLAVLTLVWNTIIFLTIEQLRSVLVIVWFVLSAVWYYVRLALYFVLRFLARQNVSRPRGPLLPSLEIYSLFIWMTLVWISTMSIALNEERRIWRNANPQIALSYLREMPYRRLYPWWTLYLVDTDLIEPALGGLSESLHELVFPDDDSNLTLMFFD